MVALIAGEKVDAGQTEATDVHDRCLEEKTRADHYHMNRMIQGE
jgi:hypothetical protein